MVRARLNLQRRRRGIFVESNRKNIQAPSGAKSSEYAAPDGASLFLCAMFYNYVATAAL